MNSHIPFDADNDWTLDPYHCNRSNDPLVDKVIGNAYAVVRAVYCNLGNLKLLYDFLNTYGMVLGVKSEVELKALTTKAAFARIYDKSPVGDRRVTDYLYVDGDRTGILPDDTTATGSWVKVATSSSPGGSESSGEGAYIPFVFNNGAAVGGETTIRVPDGTIGVPFIVVNGSMNYVGKGFEFDTATLTITLAQPLEKSDEVVCLLTGVPAVPGVPNIDNWTQINWLYNNGAAIGGEQVIEVPYKFQDISAVFKNGLRLVKGLTTYSYTLDTENNRFILTEPLAENDRLVAQIGGEVQVLSVTDHTIEEVARSANVKDSEVILSTNTTQFLNNKKIIFSVNEQKSYGLPVLPTNVCIQSVANGKLTYNPGSVVVDLPPPPSDALTLLEDFHTLLASSEGASLIGDKLPYAGAVPRTQHNKNTDTPSVKDFGVVGDGATDDTAALQAMFDAGLPVCIPEGMVCLASVLTLPEGAVLCGQGTLLSAPGELYQLLIQAVGNVDVRDITMDGSGLVKTSTAETTSIRVKDVTGGVRIHDVTSRNLSIVPGTNTHFTLMDCGSNVKAFVDVRGCTVYGSSGDSINCNTGGPYTIIGNRVYNSGDGGIALNNSAFGQVVGNYLYKCNLGVGMGPAGVVNARASSTVITGNTFEACMIGCELGYFGYSGQEGPTSVVIANNNFLRCKDRGIGYFGNSNASALSLTITGNSFYDTGSTVYDGTSNTASVAIILSYIHGVTVSGNNFTHGYYGLALGHVHCNISNNHQSGGYTLFRSSGSNIIKLSGNSDVDNAVNSKFDSTDTVLAGSNYLGYTAIADGTASDVLVKEVRLTATVGASGITLFPHGVSSGGNRFVGATGSWVNAANTRANLTFSHCDNSNVGFTGGTQGASAYAYARFLWG